MCNLDNTDAFGAPRQGSIGGALGQLQPSARGPATGFASLFRPSPRGPIAPVAPAVPTGLANLRPSVRGNPAAQAEPTGLASLTPSARGPRNRRRGLEF